MFIRSLCCVLFVVSVAAGQSFREVPNSYYVGKGEHASLDEARARAYANMVEQIQVLVSSSLRTSTTERGAAIDQVTEQSTLSSSTIMLREVQEEVEEGQGVFRVVKYVPRSVVQSIFDQRRRQVLDFLAAAEAEGDRADGVDLDRMLGYYYKAWLMTGLTPDTISYAFRFGGIGDAAAGIPRAMHLVCDALTIVPARQVEDEYTTWKYSALWRGRLVKHLRLSFHDGLGESEEEVRDGAMQATFLFADKRERVIACTLEFGMTDATDALFATADSVRAPFAPRLTMQMLLPAEKKNAAEAATRSGKFSIPAGADTIDDAAPAADRRVPSAPDSPRDAVAKADVVAPSEDAAHSGTGATIALPAPLRLLAAHPRDLAFFQKEIFRMTKRGDIVAGKKGDFASVNGLYVIVLDDRGIASILHHDNGRYTNAETGDAAELPNSASGGAGKRILWVKVQ